MARHQKNSWSGGIDRDAASPFTVFDTEEVPIPVPSSSGGSSSSSSSSNDGPDLGKYADMWVEPANRTLPTPQNQTIWDKMQNLDDKLNTGFDNFIKSNPVTEFLARAGNSAADVMTGGQQIQDNYDTGSKLANGVADLLGVAGGMVENIPGTTMNTGNALSTAVGKPVEDVLTRVSNRFGIPNTLEDAANSVANRFSQLASKTDNGLAKATINKLSQGTQYGLNNLPSYAIKGLSSGAELGAYNGATNYVNGKDVGQGIAEGMGQGMLLGMGSKALGDFTHVIKGIGKVKVLKDDGNKVMFQDENGNTQTMNKTIFDNTVQSLNTMNPAYDNTNWHNINPIENKIPTLDTNTPLQNKVAQNKPIVDINRLQNTGEVANDLKNGIETGLNEIMNTDYNKVNDIDTLNKHISELQNSIKNTTDETKLKAMNLQLFAAKKQLDIVMKKRGFIKNSVLNSDVAPDEMKNTIRQTEYEPITNKDTWDKAQKRVDSDYQNSLNEFIGNSDVKSADDTALGEALINKAIQENRIADANSLSVNLAEKLTRAGQTVQAAAIFKRLSPEGMLQYANKVIDNVNSKLPDKKKIKLPDDVAKKIVKDMQDISKMPDGQDKTEATQVVLKNIANQIPSSLLKKIDTLQTMAQLLNPKTSIRNILGNLGMQINENISNVVGTPLDMVTTGIRRLAGNKNAQRTVGLPSLGTQIKGAVEGFKTGVRQTKLGITGDNTQFDLPNGQVFKNKGIGKVLNGGQKILDYMLRVPDEATKTAIYNDSLRTQMRLAKTDIPTEEMKQIAENDSKYGTFQDTTQLSKAFGKIKQALNLDKEFGAGSLILKYPKTPANIIMRAVDYSPAGFFQSAYRLAEPLLKGTEFNQRAFVKSTSRALVGTGNLIGSGYVLGKLGIITGKGDDKTADINKSVGLGDYKLNVSALKRFVGSGFDSSQAKLQKGDKLINYDWLQPASIGLAIGANASKKVKGGDILSTIADAIDSGTTTLMQQPLITGITQFASQKDPTKAFEKALQGVPSSLTPTILKQVAQLSDNTVRNTYDPDWKNQAVNMVKSKIPGLSQDLLPNLDIWGNTQKSYENNNVGNVFFNPAFNTTYLPTPQAEKALSLYNKTANSGVLPKAPEKTITVDGQQVKLSPQQYLQLQTLTGQGAVNTYNNILGDTDSNKLAKDTSTALSNNTHDSQIKVLQDNNLPLPISVDKENLSKDLYKKTSDEAKQLRKDIKTINDSDMTTEEKKKALQDLRGQAQSAAQKNPPKPRGRKKTTN